MTGCTSDIAPREDALEERLSATTLWFTTVIIIILVIIIVPCSYGFHEGQELVWWDFFVFRRMSTNYVLTLQRIKMLADDVSRRY